MGSDDRTEFSLFGNDLFGDKVQVRKDGALAQRFEFPPFTVLSARDGDWQTRKDAWLSLGIKSEVGRGGDLMMKNQEGVNRIKDQKRLLFAQTANCDFYDLKRAKEAELGRELTTEEFQRDHYKSERAYDSGTSIFDPVLCELVYRWFCPAGGQVVDPFSGGSVRGIVAGLLGFKYWGCDLREEQIAANLAQREELTPGRQIEWHVGDANDALEAAPAADLVFTSPPYGDLEQYSDDPRDLSTMEYHTFRAAMGRILLKASQRLKPDRFLALAVGDFRDKRGHLRGWVADTITDCREMGLAYYNDAVLVTMVGSGSIRAGRQFDGGRKLVRSHQQLLVFVKGDWKKATEAITGGGK